MIQNCSVIPINGSETSSISTYNNSSATEHVSSSAREVIGGCAAHLFFTYTLWWAFVVLFVGFQFTTKCVPFYRYFHRLRYRNKPGIYDIPGPKVIPWLGTRWTYWKYIGAFKINKIHEAYQKLYCLYGSVVKEETLWNHAVVSIFGKSDIEKVLKQAGKYPFRPPNEVTAHYRKSRPDRYTNLGLVNEQGETWHHLRVTLTPELSSSRTMKHFFPELMAVTDDFVKLVDESRNSDNIVNSFEELCNRLGLESTCTLVLGKRFGFLQREVDPMGKQLADAIRGQFLASRDTFYGIPFWKVLRTPAYKRFIHCEDTIYDIISRLVEEAIQDDEDTCPSESAHCVFRSILNAPGLDIRDRRAAIIDFIAAGIKTLGNTLVFLLYLIGKHPEKQQKLYEEIESLISYNSQSTMEALQKAPYLRSCILEAFRLLPTAPCVARVLNGEVDVSGYGLQPGSIVLCHTWIACLNDQNFPNAKEYIPERWMNTELVNKTQCLLIPFGYGRRMCPGKRFVELELQVVLAQLIRNFEIRFEGKLELEFEFLLAPAADTRFCFKNRTL